MNLAKQRLPFPAISRGRLLILLAAIMWSTSGFFAKAPYFNNWPEASRGTMLAFWRALFATVVLIPLVRRPRWKPALVPSALNFVAMNITFLTAMTLTTAANAIWLQNTAPIWVFLCGALFLGERAYRRDWLQLFFVMLGVGIILFFELQGKRSAGVIWGIFGGITYSGVVLSLRYLRNEDPAWVVAVNHFVTVICLAPYVALQHVWPTGEQFIYLIGFGMLQMGLPYYFFARGLRSVPAHEASRLVLLEPLLVPIWVYLAWHHQPGYQMPGKWTFIGGALILSGLLLRSFSSLRVKEKQSKPEGND